MKTLPLTERIRYWRSLLRNTTSIADSRLIEGHADELRAALRDALHELEERSSKDGLRWRENWEGRC